MPRIAKFLMVTTAGLVISACGGDEKVVPQGSASSLAAKSAPELGQVIDGLIVEAYPEALAKDAGSRWSDVKRTLAEGQTKEAYARFVDLAEWVREKTPEMEQPKGGKTREHVATRLVYYMGRFVHDDKQPVPEIGKDAAFGVVRPGKGSTIVTPNRTAGVALPDGATSEPMVIVVAENPVPFRDSCRGPLETRQCQYPLFYRFSAFPDLPRLNKPARFGVCHVTKGPRKPEGKVHERVALAHSGGQGAKDLPEGARQMEKIRVLKPVDVTDFLYCKPDGVEYDVGAAEGRSFLGDAWTSVAMASRAAVSAFTPGTAHASMRIDQGVGGEGWPIGGDANVIDPEPH